MTVTTLTGEPVTLMIPHKEEGYVDSFIPVEWCVPRATIQELQNRGAENASLVISVVHDMEEIDRYAFSLTAAGDWITFRYPGVNTLYATIAWTEGRGSNARRSLLKRDRNSYLHSVLEWRRPIEEALQQRIIAVQHAILAAQNLIAAEEAKRPDEEETPEPVIPEDESPEDTQKRQLQDEINRLKKELELIGAVVELPDEDLIAEQNLALASLTAELSHLRAELVEARENPVQEVAMNPDYPFKWIGSETKLDVDIPHSMFGKEPRALTKWLATRFKFWPRDPRDNCEMRRRAYVYTMVPYGLLKLVQIPGLFVVEAFNLLITSLLLLFGMRKINFLPLRHPFSLWPNEIWAEVEPSVWFFKKIEPRARRNQYRCRLTPNQLGLLAITGLVAIFGAGIWLALGFEWLVRVVVLAVGMGVLVSLIIALGRALNKRPPKAKKVNPKINDYEARIEQARQAEEARLREAIARKLQPIACGAAPKTGGILASLPREKRPTYIKHAIQAKVCRPFAGK